MFGHFLNIFTGWILESQHKSPDKGRLQWGNFGHIGQSPPRKWNSMLDVSGGKSANARPSSPTKSLRPKTPTTPGADRRVGSNRRTSSPSPLRYGIVFLSHCFVMLPGAC